MRKIISVVVLIALLILPLLASAQVMQSCTLKHNLTDVSDFVDDGVDNDSDNTCVRTAVIDMATNPEYSICCVIDSVYSITDWIFIILMIVVALMVAFGAFQITTAAGAPDKMQSGRNYILYAIVGMVVAFFARAIPAIVKMIVGAA